MITPDNITKKQAKRLVKLLERETRCEVMARMGRFDNLEFIDYAVKQIEYKDKIRDMLFGTSNIVELANIFGMNKHGRRRKKR